MRAPLYADPAGTDPLYDDLTGTDPLETDAEDYLDAGSLTLTATLSAAGSRATSGVGNLHYVYNAMSAAGTKATGGAGTLAATPTLAATGIAASASVPVPIRRWPIRRPAAAPYRMGHGHIEHDALMWATGYKSSESDDELVLALAA